MSDDLRRLLKDRQANLQQVHFSSQVREQFLADRMPRPASYAKAKAITSGALARNSQVQISFGRNSSEALVDEMPS